MIWVFRILVMGVIAGLLYFQEDPGPPPEMPEGISIELYYYGPAETCEGPEGFGSPC
jgi:hypothetical protein